jgi:hypothetical protein
MRAERSRSLRAKQFLVGSDRALPLLVNPRKGAKKFVRDFCRDTNGVILPYVTVLLVVIVGVAVLALDGSRLTSLQTQLQKGTDALAIAGAGELDRLPTSTTRACNAISNLLTNSTFFGSGGSANVSASSIQFYSSLPASDTTAMGSPLCDCSQGNACSSANSVSARFVQVTAQPVSISTILPASFFGGANSATAAASAVAGFDQVTCQTVPLFMCNPYEQNGDSYAQATQRLIDNAGSLKLIELTSVQGKSGSYFPGNFGYVKPTSGSLPGGTCGAQKGSSTSVVQAMALSTPNICIRQSAINTQTGNDSNVFEALDVRFDLWKSNTGSFQQCKTDPNYAPDVNVRKGYMPGNCNNPAQAGFWPPGTTGSGSSAAVGLPVDNAMMSYDGGVHHGSGTLDPNVGFGDGNWTCGDISTSTNGATPSGNILNFASTTGISVGMAVKSSSSTVPSSAFVTAVTGTTVTMSQNVTAAVAAAGGIPSNTPITFPGYWSTAHPPGTSGNGNAPSGCTAPASITRYSVYQYEIANGYASDASGGGEKGAGAMCSSTTPVSGRRNLHVAILNCLSISMNGNSTNVPVAAFGNVFLTLPIDSPVTAPYAEFVGIDKPGNGNGFLFDEVQLYR